MGKKTGGKLSAEHGKHGIDEVFVSFVDSVLQVHLSSDVPPLFLPTKLDDNTIIIPLYYHNNTIILPLRMVF